MKLTAIVTAIILSTSQAANAIPLYKSVSGTTNDGRQYMIDLSSISLKAGFSVVFAYKLVTKNNTSTPVNVGYLMCDDNHPDSNKMTIAVASNSNNIITTNLDSKASRSVKRNLCAVVESAEFGFDYDFNQEW